MDWNPHLTETGNRGVVDLLPPRVCVGSELGKDERDRIFRDGLNFVHEFQSWRPSLVIEPKPGNIYFCKGQLSDRGKFHGADGVSWTSSGRSLENPRKAVKSFYYVASPDYRKMTREQKEIYWAEPDQPKSKVFTKKITYRKIISFHEKEYFFMIEYFGDDKALPWTPRKNLSHLNRKPSSAKLERCSAKTDRKLQTQPVVVLEKVTARPEKINPPLEAGPKVAKAVVFKTVEPLNKLVDQKEINDMLSRNPFGAMVNDALATKIVNPRAGEIYLMNLSNLDSWSGIYHCDSHSWRLRNIQTWKDYGHITFHFIFIKNAKPFSDFKKTIHFNALTKMKLIQYHGSDAGVPRSEKLYRLPSFQVNTRLMLSIKQSNIS